MADYIKSNIVNIFDSQTTAYDTSASESMSGIALVEKKTRSVAKTVRARGYAMVINLRKCVGCHACTIACKAEFNVPLSTWRSWVKIRESGIYPNIRKSFLPKLCNNCRDAPCVDVCPTKASYYGKDGTALIDDNKCIGCKLCVTACPYQQRFVNPDKEIAEKCNLCIHRVRKGLMPACVNACINGARTFGNFNDPDSKVSKLIRANKVRVLKPEFGTGPRVYYIGDVNE